MAKRTTRTPASADQNGSAKSRAAKTSVKSTTTKAAAPGAPKAPKTAAVESPAAHEVAMRAYFRYLERGGSHGRSMEDWLAAEAELVSERAVQAGKR